jgi:hypothetical protein
MRCTRVSLLILPVVVLGLLGLPGSSTAATTLCSTNTNPCTGTTYGVGTIIKTSLKSGTESVLTAAPFTVKCKGSSIAGEVTSTSGNVAGINTSLSFTSCNCTVKTLATGTFEIATSGGAANGNGSLSGIGSSVEYECLGLRCIFGTALSAPGTVTGTITGGNPAVVTINAKVVYLGGAGSAVCTGGTLTATWTASYEVTSPKPLFVE